MSGWKRAPNRLQAFVLFFMYIFSSLLCLCLPVATDVKLTSGDKYMFTFNQSVHVWLFCLFVCLFLVYKSLISLNRRNNVKYNMKELYTFIFPCTKLHFKFTLL